MESTNEQMKRILAQYADNTRQRTNDLQRFEPIETPEESPLERYERVTRGTETEEASPLSLRYINAKEALRLSEDTRLKLCDALRAARDLNWTLGTLMVVSLVANAFWIWR